MQPSGASLTSLMECVKVCKDGCLYDLLLQSNISKSSKGGDCSHLRAAWVHGLVARPASAPKPVEALHSHLRQP